MSNYFLLFIVWFAVLAIGQYILGRAYNVVDNWRACIPGMSFIHFRDIATSSHAISVAGICTAALTVVSVFMIWNATITYYASGMMGMSPLRGTMIDPSDAFMNIGRERQTIMKWSMRILQWVYVVLMYDLLKRLGYPRVFALMPLQIMPVGVLVISIFYARQTNMMQKQSIQE